MVCHDREHCKMAEPIELPFGMLSGVSSGNDVFNAVQIPSYAGAILRGKGATHCIGTLCHELGKNG